MIRGIAQGSYQYSYQYLSIEVFKYCYSIDASHGTPCIVLGISLILMLRMSARYDFSRAVYLLVLAFYVLTDYAFYLLSGSSLFIPIYLPDHCYRYFYPVSIAVQSIDW